MHQAIFWGMVVLFVGTALATVDQDFTNLLVRLPDPPRPLLPVLRVRAGRVRRRPDRGRGDGRLPPLPGPAATACRPRGTGVSLWDAFPFLTVLLLIAVTGFRGRGAADCRRVSHRGPSAPPPTSRRRQAGVLDAHGPRASGSTSGRERQEAQLQPHRRGRAGLSRRGLGSGRLRPGQGCWRRCRSTRSACSHQVALVGARAAGLRPDRGIPFTKAFHLISSPANMLLRNAAPAGPAAGGGGIGRADRCATSPGGNCCRSTPAPGAASARRSAPATTPAFRSRRATWSRPSTAQLLRTPAKANGDTPSLHESRRSRPRSFGPAARAGRARKSARCSSSSRG